MKKKVVLTAALDWGLGHTTRCIPIYKELINRNFSLIVAGTQAQINLLRGEVPQAEYRLIKGYNIRYSSKKIFLSIAILLQLPKIFGMIWYERRWVKRFIRHYSVDLILSDNRPGFTSGEIHSIYITHQLSIRTRFSFLSHLASRLHQQQILRFDECWVPDTSEHTLSGALSVPVNDRISPRFIGPLSRFQSTPGKPMYDVAIILSGPEPQRSILERKLVHQITESKFRIALVRGVSSDHERPTNLPSSTIMYNYLPSDRLNKLIATSALVICRSGYTSVMDLAKLKTKAVLIPTPGQGEQEYLAEYLASKKYFLSRSQHNISLAECIAAAKSSELVDVDADFELFKSFIADL